MAGKCQIGQTDSQKKSGEKVVAFPHKKLMDQLQLWSYLSRVILRMLR